MGKSALPTPEKAKKVLDRWKKVKERVDKEPAVIAGDKILDVDEQAEFRSGKYDEELKYPNYPDAGMRFYFDQPKTSYITDRPSGTGPQLRFYVHLF